MLYYLHIQSRRVCMAEKSWSVSDKFWERVEPLIPKAKHDKTKAYQRRKGGGRIFVQMQDTLVKNRRKLCKYTATNCTSVLEAKKKLRYRTDSKRIAGLWRLSVPSSIDSENCLSDMKRQIGHMNHCFNWQPVLSFLEN